MRWRHGLVLSGWNAVLLYVVIDMAFDGGPFGAVSLSTELLLLVPLIAMRMCEGPDRAWRPSWSDPRPPRLRLLRICGAIPLLVFGVCIVADWFGPCVDRNDERPRLLANGSLLILSVFCVGRCMRLWVRGQPIGVVPHT